MGAGSAFTEGVFQMLEAEKAVGWSEREALEPKIRRVECRSLQDSLDKVDYLQTNPG